MVTSVLTVLSAHNATPPASCAPGTENARAPAPAKGTGLVPVTPGTKAPSVTPVPWATTSRMQTTRRGCARPAMLAVRDTAPPPVPKPVLPASQETSWTRREDARVSFCAFGLAMLSFTYGTAVGTYHLLYLHS